MRTFLKALLIVPMALLVVLFAVANRQVVRLSLDPVSRDAPLYGFDAPLFAVVIAAVAIGVIIGGCASWLAQGKHRKARRVLGKEAERLRAEADTLRGMATDAALTALPSRRG